jgi:hypothetical protein
VERAGPDIHGMSVHIGARVGAAASAGEVLVSRTVRDLVIGSGLRFSLKGDHDLKGIPGTWELYALDSERESDGEQLDPRSNMTSLDRAALQTARRAPRLARTAVRLGNAWQRRRVASR